MSRRQLPRRIEVHIVELSGGDLPRAHQPAGDAARWRGESRRGAPNQTISNFLPLLAAT
jgi:hypothetical protein